jgi:MoaA/NifB/PqqE/SkfB family radical SAM enzyme
MVSSSLPPVGFSFLKAFIADVLGSAWGGHQPGRPLILTYFVTFRCNLECTYCEYANNNFAHQFPELDTRDAREVLRICREGNPAVAFTGGEPLVRDDIVQLVHYARELRYRPISIFTNSLLLPDREELLNDVDYLQISLDTPDADLQDRLCGLPGIGDRIIRNIQHYASLQREKNFRLNINCVLSPETFGCVSELLRFAAETKVRLSILPQLDDQGQPPAFFRDPEVLRQYQEAIDTILSRKPSKDVVFDTVPFLQHLRELKSERCYPLLTPRVFPDGTLRYPCSIVCRSAFSILAMGSWKRAKRALESVSTECPSPCLSPCYLQTSLLAQHPLVLLQEFG